jgi:hypothetical protein
LPLPEGVRMMSTMTAVVMAPRDPSLMHRYSVI